jgi:hypothetical protein
MDDVLRLIEKKNRCLGSLLDCSQKFLSEAQHDGSSAVYQYEKARAKWFNLSTVYDRLINQRAKSPIQGLTDPKFSQQLKTALEHQKTILTALLEMSQKIIELLETQKSEISLELNKSDQHRSLLIKFRSTWVAEAGQGLDGTL